MYREGFETALFYQSLLSFGDGPRRLHRCSASASACVALAGVAVAVFQLGRKLPVRTFMNIAVVLVMVTSVAFLGNAVHTLQAADVITLPAHELAAPADLPRRGHGLLADRAVARRPDRRCSLVYVLGALYTFVVAPASRRTASGHRRSPACRPRMTARSASASTSAARSPRRSPSTLDGRAIVARRCVPTTHAAAGGVAAGVVDAVAELAAEVGAEQIELVTHSTTQAVNALLEGDVGEVGVIGMGRRPGSSSGSRSAPGSRDVELAAGQAPADVSHAFFDVTDGLPEPTSGAALDRRLRDAGVAAVCVAEAFAPDDASNETRGRRAGRRASGLPVVHVDAS